MINVHNYRYPLHGLAATRGFLAATGKTLGFSPEKDSETGGMGKTPDGGGAPDLLTLSGIMKCQT